jgi:hypothetical protein
VDAIQVDLWNQESGEIIAAIISPQSDGRRYQLSVEAPELGLSLHGPDLFAADGTAHCHVRWSTRCMQAIIPADRR